MSKIITALVLFLSVSLTAQEEFNFNFDYAQFGYDTTSNYVEFYYSFRQSEMTVSPKENGFSVSGILEITLTDSATGEYIVNRRWRVNNVMPDTSETSMNTSLIGVVGFVLDDGVYNATVTGKDLADTTLVKSLKEKIEINPRKGKLFSISDIELASSIKKEGANSSSIFYKNTLEVMPNPVMIYNRISPVLYYYAELYNLSADSEGKPLALRRALFNSKGKLIEEKIKDIKRDNESIVEVGTINMIKYPTDSYTLEIALIDTINDHAAVTSKRFYHVNPSVKDTTRSSIAVEGYLGSEFGVMSEEEADMMFEQISFITTSGENDQYQSLESLKSKRKFLYNFWQSRDSNPETDINEFKREYMDRVEYAKRFKAFQKPGHKTDRGRVYIMYGAPDQIDRYPNETDTKPYEIWYYNSIEGGVMFIFGDLTGFSDFELLSSTKRGEIRDDNWMRRIQSR